LPAPKAAGDVRLLEEAVHEAGAIARGYFGGQFKSWDKGKGQPVTEADLEVDQFLHGTLMSARPSYGWLSEESPDNLARRSAARTFIIDPIDGTIAFLKGRPHFTICAAVVADGRPIAGAIYNPITEEMFSASAGAGATLNGGPIAVADRGEISGCRMLAPKTLFADARWNTPPATAWPTMTVESRGSIAYRMALVAGGGFDAMLALSAKHDWDLAAGDLIVSEAGGRVTNHQGKTLRYNGAEPIQPSIVCAGPRLHRKLLEKLADIDPTRH
jgi:myo-inositol-1(or 4)-monophosphatase